MGSATTLATFTAQQPPLLTCTLFEEVRGRVGSRCVVFLFFHGI